jgi:8-hydroxy-5-deazaflavin:NADPH oxidoreductase
VQPQRVGIIGGTGPAGSGLAVRLAAAGHDVLLGSREASRAASRSAELRALFPDRLDGLAGVANGDAALADIVILATVADSIVPTAAEHADALAGRVVVSMANLLRRNARGFAAVLPPEGSVALAVQQAAPASRIVGAYQNLPASGLLALDQPIDADVIVCGDDADAVAVILDLTASVPGLHPVDGGPLANTAAVESMTAVLLTVNRARRGEHTVKLVHLHD